MKKIKLNLLLLLIATSGFSQNIDSLWDVWNNVKMTDSVRFKTIKTIAQLYLYNSPDSSFIISKLHYDFAKGKNNKIEMADALSTQGIAKDFLSDFSEAMLYHEKSLKLYEEADYKLGISNALSNIGMIYYNQSNYSKAVIYHTKSLKIRESINYKKGIASSLGNIGNIYKDVRDFSKSIEYLEKALVIFEELKNIRAKAIVLENLSLCYIYKGDYLGAEPYVNESLKISESINDIHGIANSYTNMSMILKEKKEYEKSIEYNLKAIDLHKKMGNKQAISVSLNNIGYIKYLQKKYPEAITNSEKALAIAKEIGGKDEIKNSARNLANAYKFLNNSQKALTMLELYETIRDSILNEETQKEVIKQEVQYQYEKKALADSIAFVKEKEIKESEIARQQAELKVKRNQQYALFGGLALVILFSFIIYNRLKVTQQQNKIIESQKQIVEDKNYEILQSITYAKRLQQSILPPPRLVKEYMKDSFVLYMPKDIVAGDFYWIESHNNKIYFAAADCTGHGVPGAMVSMVCHNALNRALLEFGLENPSLILDKASEIVDETFSKSEDNVQDGMDISLYCLDTKTLELEWAGANNPLWMIQAGELVEIKPDKQPVGRYENRKPFTNHTLKLSEGDSLFSITDGYADQFGGEKGKKYTYKKLREFLLSINNKPMSLQKDELIAEFDKWKQNNEQVDDICLIGVKV